MTDKQENNIEEEKTVKQEQADSVNEQKDEPVSSKMSKAKHNLVTVFLFLVLVIVSALSIYNQMLLRQFNEDMSVLDQSAKFNDIKQQFEQQIDKRQAMFTDIEERLSEIENNQLNLQSLVTKQTTQSSDVNIEFALAEIEYLLTIANYRLQLSHDVSTAITAIQAADKRLQGLNVSGKIQLREQLIADINNLQSMNQADLSGLGLFLSDLINRVDELPLNDDAVINDPHFSENKALQDQQENSTSDFFSLVWDELKSLVIISRDENVSKVMLLPDQVYFLRANLKLELANARFAVFNRDSDNFNSSVELIQTWLNNYCDSSDASVKNILQSLQTMKKLELEFPIMDLSSSIETVRAMSHQLNNVEQ